jgi:hypothetical protein
MGDLLRLECGCRLQLGERHLLPSYFRATADALFSYVVRLAARRDGAPPRRFSLDYFSITADVTAAGWYAGDGARCCKVFLLASVWREVRWMSKRKRGLRSTELRQVVYDGYYGDFVPVEQASFDVSTTPEAVVELPWPTGPTGDAKPPRRRTSAQRCDACRQRRRDVARTRDGLLKVCRTCARCGYTHPRCGHRHLVTCESLIIN